MTAVGIAEVLARNGLPKDECERKAARLGVGPTTRFFLVAVARLLTVDVEDIDPEDPHVTPDELRRLKDARAILAEVLR